MGKKFNFMDFFFKINRQKLRKIHSNLRLKLSIKSELAKFFCNLGKEAFQLGRIGSISLG